MAMKAMHIMITEKKIRIIMTKFSLMCAIGFIHTASRANPAVAAITAIKNKSPTHLQNVIAIS
ncbi:MAG: hypothetical protein AAB819_01750 [Patescibacteria group bacterium]